MEQKLLLIDGIKWHVRVRNLQGIEALCPVDYLRLTPYPSGFNEFSTNKLVCAECNKIFSLPRHIDKEKIYIINKIDSKAFKQMKVLNLDDEAVPIAESKASSKDGKFFVTAVMVDSKVGQRVVVYAGEKGRKEKTQIFIEPNIKRLAFDQNDLHPADVFLALDGTFEDGTSFSIKNKNIPAEE